MDYFHDFFPEEARQETVMYHAAADAALPDEYYAFLETYCTNPECDCNDVMIQIEPQRHGDQLHAELSAMPTAVIRYALDKPRSKNNPCLYPDAPVSPMAHVALKVFRNYAEQHPGYQKKLRGHYAMMKEIGLQHTKSLPALLPIQKEPATGRNELCLCGSGKKFKKCCLHKQAS